MNNNFKNYILLFLLSVNLLACKTTQQFADNQRAINLQKRQIPCTYMRGGTSKGPFFDKRELPSNKKERDAIILKVMGSPDHNQIDGLGAAVTVTSKVVMAEPSKRPNIDVDYLFAQVDIDNPIVDTLPPCGNMMAGVGPFAIEKGWVKATKPETRVRIFNINTNSVIEEIVQTPNGVVEYNGNAQIDGVPGTAAPIIMNLSDQVGGKTGKQLPTGNLKEIINGIEVSILDAGSLMVLMKAKDLGLVGNENKEFFENNKELMAKLEAIRLEAGLRAGMGHVKDSVLPKIGILSSPTDAKHHIRSLYFTPKTLHPSHAVTGAICVGTALKLKGTVASEVGKENGQNREFIIIEHPAGIIEVNIEMKESPKGLVLDKAGTLRTVRKIMEGYVFY
ncbi:PrpF domain-containing protein [Arcicella sp. LKC2W]|uniref:2-methylaconitate cis-trans isomerase PrpF family protein n=1 Tax=Arcicella sp. LKC2W TaxID=2984198 RepID=UPI002B20A26F|nr:PrpF domain-containing protein [Arcicella sp. LKC2W]MEA5458843.1 PrpF domain-containing protein [Arcicella sp. LKC2W]